MTEEEPTTTTFSLPQEPQDLRTEAPEASPGPASAANPEPRPFGRARATLTIIAVNTLAWLLTLALCGPGHVGNWLGLDSGPGESGVLLALGAKDNELIQSGEYWRLISPIFLHWGIPHLVFNNLVLLVLGSAVERLFGPVRFLILYLFSGLCGSIASYEFSTKPGVGASGAIFGLAGVIIIFALRHRRQISPRFRDEVLTVLLPLVFLQFALGFAFQFVDVQAHIGGFLGGCLLSYLVESRLMGTAALSRERLPLETAVLTGALLVGYAGFSAAANLRSALPLGGVAAPGQPALAAAYLNRLVERKPQLIQPRILLAALAEKAGDWAGVAEQYRELLRHHEQRVGDDEAEKEIGVLLTDALQRAGRETEAAAVYRDLLRRYPKDPLLLNNAAYLYVDTLNSHYSEALEMAKRAVQLRPNEGTFVDTLAWAYYKLGEIDQAAATQERAVKLRGDVPEVHYHMGVIEEARGKREAAVVEYRTALKLDPKFGPARERLDRGAR